MRLNVDNPVVNERSDELLDEDLKADDGRYMIGNPAQIQRIFSSSSSIPSGPDSPSIPRDSGSGQQLSQYIQMMHQQDQSQISLRSASTNPPSVAAGAAPSEYNYDDYINSPQMEKTRHAKFNSNEPLPPPFTTKNCCSRFIYGYQTCIATNPRYLSLWVLYRAIWPRALVCIDLYTDGLVAYQLYTSNEIVLFTLSFTFLLFPFVVVWSVSLRFLQKFVNGLSKDKKWITYFVLLYLFPPIGCIIVTIYEIVWVVYDFFKGLLSFCRRTILILDKDATTSSVKSYAIVEPFVFIFFFFFCYFFHRFRCVDC